MEIIKTTDNVYNFAVKLDSLITMPDDFDPAKESLPLIVFLHGAGERGFAPEELKCYGIPKLFGSDPCYGGHRVITLSPVCPKDMQWTQLEYQLMALIEETVEKYNADRDRISLSGVSMGGFGTWSMGSTFPGYFAALAPICGGGAAWRAGIISRAGTPVRAYHGAKDMVVPLSATVEMVEAMRKTEGRVKLIVFNDSYHDSWVPAFEGSPDLVRFLAEAHK